MTAASFLQASTDFAGEAARLSAALQQREQDLQFTGTLPDATDALLLPVVCPARRIPEPHEQLQCSPAFTKWWESQTTRRCTDGFLMSLLFACAAEQKEAAEKRLAYLETQVLRGSQEVCPGRPLARSLHGIMTLPAECLAATITRLRPSRWQPAT